jgi:hypothetical protein
VGMIDTTFCQSFLRGLGLGVRSYQYHIITLSVPISVSRSSRSRSSWASSTPPSASPSPAAWGSACVQWFISVWLISHQYPFSVASHGVDPRVHHLHNLLPVCDGVCH